MIRFIGGLGALILVALGLSACSGDNGYWAPTPGAGTTPAATAVQGGPTMTTAANYPRYGHAPDYSWIAGQVNFTRIQGSCIYIRTAEMPTPSGPTPTLGTGPILVGTAVRNDTSPPLRDITPVVGPGTPDQGPIGDAFVPSGPGWDPDKVKDGQFVVAFGRLAGPGDATEMCPGGRAYVIDKLQTNP